MKHNSPPVQPAQKKQKPQGNKIAVFRIIMIAIVVAVVVLSILEQSYHSAFLGLVALALFNIPLIVDRSFHLKLPDLLEIVVFLFVFASQILGEIGSFYTHIRWWDTMLHTVNGFIMAALGFALIDLLNNSPRFHFNLSPVFVAFVAFCFSMTVGVLWEFFEFSMDTFVRMDMQKDHLQTAISSCLINPSGINDPIKLSGITETVVHYTKNGEPLEYVIDGGFLDIGIYDTMKDLIVNCIGAVVFSIIGYFYIIGRNKSKIAQRFIPQMKTAEEIEQTKKEQAERRENYRNQIQKYTPKKKKHHKKK